MLSVTQWRGCRLECQGARCEKLDKPEKHRSRYWRLFLQKLHSRSSRKQDGEEVKKMILHSFSLELPSGTVWPIHEYSQLDHMVIGCAKSMSAQQHCCTCGSAHGGKLMTAFTACACSTASSCVFAIPWLDYRMFQVTSYMDHLSDLCDPLLSWSEVIIDYLHHPFGQSQGWHHH